MSTFGHCPFCDAVLTSKGLCAVFPSDSNINPCPGDYILCRACGCLLVINDELKVRPPRPFELAKFMDHPRLVQLAAELGMVTRRYGLYARRN